VAEYRPRKGDHFLFTVRTSRTGRPLAHLTQRSLG
jgi:hypothetical protein